MSLQIEYKNRNPKGHWFDADTMRFFQTRIGKIRAPEHAKKFDDAGRWYFVTNEKPPNGQRRYSCRVMGLSGEIQTFGPFCELTEYRAEKLVDIAAERNLSATELLSGPHMLEAIAKAAKEWEVCGSITPECKMQRENADYWAKGFCRLEWSAFAPWIHHNEQGQLTIEQFKKRISVE